MVIELEEMRYNLIPWICNLWFREHSQKFSGQLPSVFQSMSEKDIKKVSSFQHCFPQNAPLVSLNRSLALLLILIVGNLIFFRSQPEILSKNTFLFEKTSLLSKQSSALEESSFKKLSEKSVLKVGNWQNGHWTSRNVMKYNPLDM